MKRSSIVLMLVALLVTSCKKDRLKDDKEVLIGNWVWNQTYHQYNNCAQCCTNYDTLYPIDSSFEIEFLSNGKLNFYENNLLSEGHRIVFDQFYFSDLGAGPEGYVFVILLDNDPEKKLSGQVINDGKDIYTWNFPFKPNDPPCDEYKNFFSKK